MKEISKLDVALGVVPQPGTWEYYKHLGARAVEIPVDLYLIGTPYEGVDWRKVPGDRLFYILDIRRDEYERFKQGGERPGRTIERHEGSRFTITQGGISVEKKKWWEFWK